MSGLAAVGGKTTGEKRDLLLLLARQAGEEREQILERVRFWDAVGVQNPCPVEFAPYGVGKSDSDRSCRA